MFRFQRNYFLFFLLLLGIEVLIALFINDDFIRPYVGDLLVVILLYCFVRSFLQTRVIASVAMVLLFAYAVETAQYLAVIHHLGLDQNRLARTVMGSSFDWQDVAAYTLGAALILLVEKIRMRKQVAKNPLP